MNTVRFYPNPFDNNEIASVVLRCLRNDNPGGYHTVIASAVKQSSTFLETPGQGNLLTVRTFRLMQYFLLCSQKPDFSFPFYTLYGFSQTD